VFPHVFPILVLFEFHTVLAMFQLSWIYLVNGGGMAKESMTKYASILGRDTFRHLCWGVFHVPKILVMGQSNGISSG
jgi:hypothetical protein